MSLGQVIESRGYRDALRERDEALEAANVRGVSVVVPCYEQQEYLERSMASVAAQTMQPLEVLIIDDGSRTPIVWDGDGVRIIRVSNRGLPNARNTGLLNARGHAFLPLDADDWLEPTYIEKTLPLLDAGADVVVTGLQEHGERHGLYRPGCDLGLANLTVEAERRSNRLFYCNPPEAPIWMGDYTFRPLGDIQLGDEVIGWERPPGTPTHSPRPTLTRSTVLAIEVSAPVPVVRVVMESGREFRCTDDHRWLVHQQRQRPYTGRVGNGFEVPLIGKGRDGYAVPEVGRTLCQVVDPVSTSDRTRRVSGYLAGLYDGEGSGRAISQSEETNPDVCESIARSLSELDIPFTNTKYPDKCLIFWVSGGRQKYVEFINKVGPVRVRSWDKEILTTKFRTSDRIVSVTPDGSSEVFSLQTSTGNYVAWGYASKNCSLFRTSLLRNVGGYNGRMIHGYEDWDLWIDLMQRGARMAAVDEPLFNYRTRSDGMLAQTEAEWRDWNWDEMARHHGYDRPQPPARASARESRIAAGRRRR